jgi:hypothetical protein
MNEQGGRERQEHGDTLRAEENPGSSSSVSSYPPPAFATLNQIITHQLLSQPKINKVTETIKPHPAPNHRLTPGPFPTSHILPRYARLMSVVQRNLAECSRLSSHLHLPTRHPCSYCKPHPPPRPYYFNALPIGFGPERTRRNQIWNSAGFPANWPTSSHGGLYCWLGDG